MTRGAPITYLAETSVLGKQTRFGIYDHDRLEHVSVIGRVGSDRATFLANMALQDIERGVGTVIVDAAGYFSELILERLPEEVLNRVVYIDPSDAEFPFSWNSLDDFRSVPEAFGRASLIDALAALYRTPPSPLLEFVAEEMVRRDDSTMLFLYDVVQDMHRRDVLLPKGSPARSEFDALLLGSAEGAEQIAQHGRYLARDTLMRNILGQSTSKFTLESLSQGSVVVVDVSRIRVFPTRITPLVRLFVHAARVRAAHAESPPALYVYDAVRYLSEYDIEHMLPERKIAFTLSDATYFEEDRTARARVLARSGSIISFSPGHADGPLAEKIFFPYVGLEDLHKLDAGECAVLLSIDAVRARPFFARIFPLSARHNVSLQDIRTFSRDRFSLARHKVDQLFLRKAPAPQSAVGTDPGSFSSAFRSIFAKSAGQTPPPTQSGATTPKSPPQSMPGVLQTEPKADANHKTAEIPEEELRKMLHVDPLSP